MILTRRSNLSCTLLTCCGRHRGLLKRALRRMRRSCLHQLVLRLLEVDSSTTTGAEDASWLQREQQVVASSVELQLRSFDAYILSDTVTSPSRDARRIQGFV